MKEATLRVVLAAGVCLLSGAANAGLLEPYSTEPICDEKGECFDPWVSGHEGFFCEPLNGFHDWLVLGEGIGSLWTLMDCETGETLDAVIYDRPNIDLFDEVVAYRKQMNLSANRESLQEIAAHLTSLKTRFAFRDELIEAAELRKWCAFVPPIEEVGCLE